ncbi:MAG: 4-(cytidine 5'-diphospho)-2-C-methyl-D-erythritol kinase [Rubrivivax sp.]|nr:4-(cytidine 5'-diphospho)-2-C-methyl-D-erythritol kinase [Rubrivivax sp.]
MSLLSLTDIPAPAKLNLFLHVVGRRADGYHLLESVFVLIDWCDTLHVERRADGRLQRHDLTEPLPADDLCLRAARALQAASGCSLGADISIAKQVPAGAGMGGGSSDAASVLLALNRLWGLQWPRERLQDLAQTLGADVPFFIFGRTALVLGIGEQLSALDLPPQDFAVVKPAASIATASIFSSPLLKRDTPSAILAGSLDSRVLAGLSSGYGHNDLQPPAQAACTEVAQAARWLEQRFGNSRMTGSGSAVFSRVGPEDPTAATWPTEGADALPEGWVGRRCRSLPRHPLVDWAG